MNALSESPLDDSEIQREIQSMEPTDQLGCGQVVCSSRRRAGNLEESQPHPPSAAIRLKVLKRGDFAGLRETRLVMDQRVFDGRSESGTKMDEIAIGRMQHAGIGVTSTIQVMSELVFNWAEGAGPKILPVLGEIYADLGE